MSITGKLNSIPVLSNAVRKLNNFFKTSKRFCQGGTDGRCQDWLQSDSQSMDEASAERTGHLVCSQSFLEEGAVGNVFVSIMLQQHTGALLLLMLFTFATGRSPRFSPSPSGSNLDRLIHVVTKQSPFRTEAEVLRG